MSARRCANVGIFSLTLSAEKKESVASRSGLFSICWSRNNDSSSRRPFLLFSWPRAIAVCLFVCLSCFASNVQEINLFTGFLSSILLYPACLRTFCQMKLSQVCVRGDSLPTSRGKISLLNWRLRIASLAHIFSHASFYSANYEGKKRKRERESCLYVRVQNNGQLATTRTTTAAPSAKTKQDLCWAGKKS